MLDNKYDVFVCDSTDSKRINYHIRYKTFCLEKKFESAERFSDQMEQDKYDDYAIHFLLREPEAGSWIGASRLITTPTEQLPIFKVCDVENREYYTDLSNCAEISRLCILSEHRRSMPGMMLHLIKAMYYYSLEHNIENWFALHTNPLARIIKSKGFNSVPISCETEFRGIRRAYFTTLNQLLQPIKNKSPETYAMFSKDNAFRLYSEYINQQKVA